MTTATIDYFNVADELAAPRALAEYSQLAEYSRLYADAGFLAEMQPLRIVAELVDGAPVCDYDPIHLDNLLARAVVDRAQAEHGIIEWEERPAVLPAPLKVLWRDPRGLPLYASTCFFPAGESVDDKISLQKRAMSGRYVKTARGTYTLRTSSGRDMERRIPVPVRITHQWEALCIGHRAEIETLLAPITHIGKRRNIGWGEVRRWRIAPVPEFHLTRRDEEGREVLARAVPMAAASDLGLEINGGIALTGWTPPQWKPETFVAGWPVGAVA